MRFLSNFGCKIIFMCYINFWHQQVYNSLHWSHDLLVQEAYYDWKLISGKLGEQ